MSLSVFAGHIVGEPSHTSVSGTLSKALPLSGDPVLRFLNRLPAFLTADFEAERLVLKNAKDWKKVRDLRALNLLEAGKVGDTLYAVLEYHPGRLLSDVLERLRREGMPLAADQAVYLAERAAGAALSLAEQGLTVGGLSPDRLFVTFEGEVKVLPALFKGLATTSLAAAPELEAYARYLPAPDAAQAFKGASDVHSLGALLFEFLTRQPFRNAPGAAFDPAARLERGRKGLEGAEPIPDNLYPLLKKSLLPGTPEAFRSLSALKEQLDLLITSGEYSPTTFNIAFLMHSLYRGEDEAEDAADKAFLALDRTPYQKAAPPEAPAPSAAGVPAAPKGAPEQPPPEIPIGAEAGPEGRKGLWIGLAAAAVVVVVGAGIFFALRSRGPSSEEIQAKQQLEALEKERALFKAQQEEMARRMKALEEEKAALAEQVSKAKTTEEKARAQKALEEAQQRLKAQEEEQRRLQEAARKTETKPSAAPSPPPSAAPAAPPPASSSVQEPPAAEPAPPPAAEAPPAAPAAAPKVQPGDFVELWAVDIKPKQIGPLQLDVTSPARQNRLRGTFYVEVDVNERGEVTDARVVRGPSPDFGMNEACRRAALKLRYSPALKDGVPVKTKVTFPILLK